MMQLLQSMATKRPSRDTHQVVTVPVPSIARIAQRGCPAEYVQFLSLHSGMGCHRYGRDVVRIEDAIGTTLSNTLSAYTMDYLGA